MFSGLECKGYDICNISKRKALKENFFKDLSKVANMDELKSNVLAVLENGGKVYGLKKKKELVALMLFEREEKDRHEFEKLATQDAELGMTLDKLPKKLKKVVIYNFVGEFYIEGHDEALESFYKAIRNEMKELILLGNCYLVNLKDEVLSLEDIETEHMGTNTGGLAIGILLGLTFGIIFDNIGLGLCLGVAYALCFGGFSKIKNADDKKPEDEINETEEK